MRCELASTRLFQIRKRLFFSPPRFLNEMQEAERSEVCVNPQGNTFFQSPPVPPSNSATLLVPTFGFGGPCASLICAGQGDLNRDQIIDISDLGTCAGGGKGGSCRWPKEF